MSGQPWGKPSLTTAAVTFHDSILAFISVWFVYNMEFLEFDINVILFLFAIY